MFFLAQIDLIYVFSFVWSFGCNLDDASRSKFVDFASALLSPLIPDDIRGHDLFGFYVDPAGMALVPWATMMSRFQYDAKESYFNILVPTVDTTRYAYMMRTLIASGRNVLFAGDTGVGKSVIVVDALTKMTTGADAKFVSATVNFSAQTQSWNLQEVIETKLDKKRKNRCVP